MSNQVCLCGRQAFKFKWGGFVCERCDHCEHIQQEITGRHEGKEQKEKEKKFSRDILRVSKNHSEERYLDAYCGIG